MKRLLSLVACACLAACSSSSSGTSTPVTAADAGASADASASASDDAGPPLAAADYCETIAGFFCDFYMRCGRMVAANTDECKATFLETCNARYEPRDVALASAGLVALSQPGVDACAAHLATVACDKQWTDLAGPCSGMWLGTSPAGSPCGMDVESFVCEPGTSCTLGLDLCGKCEAVSGLGDPCGTGTRCAPDAYCANGTCAARPLPGDACDDQKPCATGVQCVSGTCVAPAIVGEGAACDAQHRCAYRSLCQSGHCVRTSLLGGECTTDTGCASGRCVAGKCEALLADGAPCASPLQCRSGQCVTGACAPLPSACFRK